MEGESERLKCSGELAVRGARVRDEEEEEDRCDLLPYPYAALLRRNSREPYAGGVGPRDDGPRKSCGRLCLLGVS